MGGHNNAVLEFELTDEVFGVASWRSGVEKPNMKDKNGRIA